MTFPGDRRLFTHLGTHSVRVWLADSCWVAALLDGSLLAFGDTQDEAVSRPASALDETDKHATGQPVL